MPRVFDAAKDRLNQAMTMPRQGVMNRGPMMNQGALASAATPQMLDPSVIGQRHLSGAIPAPQTVTEMQQYEAGQLPGYAATSPTVRRVASERALAGDQQPQPARIREQSMAAVARANTPNATMGGMTPNDWIASKAGTGVDIDRQKYEEYRRMLSLVPNEVNDNIRPSYGTDKEMKRAISSVQSEYRKSAALAKIAERKAALQRGKSVNPQGLAYNAMQQAQMAQEEQGYRVRQQNQQSKMQEDAAKSAPKISDLKGILPPEDDELSTDEGFDNWHSRALKRWEAVQSGQPAYTPPPPPMTPKETWGSIPGMFKPPVTAPPVTSYNNPQHPDNMPANPEGLPMPQTKEEYDALPPGTRYIHPSSKTTKVKG